MSWPRRWDLTWFRILHCEGNTGDGDDTEKEATQRKPVWVSSLNKCFLQIWLHWKKHSSDQGPRHYTLYRRVHCFTVCGYESLENQISVSSSPQSCGSQGSVVLLWLAAALTVTSGAQYARALRQSKLLVDCSVFVQFRDGKTNKENLPGESTCCSEFQKV